MVSIWSRFDSRRNSLNFLRLVLALAVVVSHTWPLGGYGPDPTFAHQQLGIWAVIGFFAISGYLIATSRMHTSMITFMVRRVLRIYPAYLVCLVVIAVGFAPLSQSLGGGPVRWTSSISYVFHNLFLKVFQDNIENTLRAAPFGPAWDGSLWTLIYEFLCYISIGALLSAAVRWQRPLVVAAFALTASLAALEQHTGHTGMLWAFSFLGAFFFAGSIVAVFGDRIPIDWRLGIAAIVIAVAGAQVGGMAWISAFPAAYVFIWLGIALPFQRLGRVNDISYGVYIYAFPVQQIIFVSLGARRLPVGAAVVLSIVATLPFAAASWFIVERRALALKRRFSVAAARTSGPDKVAKHSRSRSAPRSPILERTDSS